MTQLRLCSVLGLLLLATSAIAATVSYDWDVTWVNASPDGFERPVIGINGAWPCPTIAANVGDTIVLTINNQLGNETTGIHFHGIDQINTSWMDGANGVAHIIVNEGLGANVTFDNDKTYRFRIISFAAFGSAMFSFDTSNMQVVMIDASYVEKAPATQLRIAPSQRYDVLISVPRRRNCKPVTSANYPFLLSLDINRDYTNDLAQSVWQHNYTGYLVTNPTGDFPEEVVTLWRPADDATFVPLDGAVALGPVSQEITLDFDFCRDENNLPRACFNNNTYIPQKVPTLYSVATTGSDNTNPIVYGDVLPYILPLGTIATIVVNNLDAAIHPFHLHGHQFQVLARPESGAGTWDGQESNLAATPPRRDTIAVNANSYAVLRIQVAHPGVFLFHCHIEWHVEMGLTATFIQAPELLRNITFPADHIDNCIKQNIPYQGNAAGNTADVLDTSDFNTVPPVQYEG
ncbi:iron transport multicopper oxidase fet3 precursor [Sporothrix brasiliensis 5110]|uniref:Iron transport multicopper oxidase fet3 n=1 Tax=Sporothrix brasiliensis 5110 TaxID=1398154 RepID=A0A0C2IJ75_9PEZI|nr:iron transport multicopper oxidase fet3 precursor [Sporothrix brasiliensis 5110]KIH87025.1 iron transport multicopper oxidase fet3 precursor [Sporothrix brasiliensis 5110]